MVPTVSKGNKHRKRLFDAQRVTNTAGESFAVCPICLALFPEEAIYSSKSQEPVLRIEHAPATATGSGIARCLTCGPCNNERAFEARAGNDRSRRKGTELSLDGLRGVASVAPSKVSGLLRGSPIPADLLMLARKNEYLSELKTAYLIAFATLGYTYILDTRLDPIREVLTSGELAFQPCMIQEEGSWLTRRVWVTGGEFASVRVTMDAEHPSNPSGQHVVDLPWKRSPIDLYERLHPQFTIIGRRSVPLGDIEMYGWPDELTLDRRWDVGADEVRLPSGEQVHIGVPPLEDVATV